MIRRIVHVDMDAFYASVEQRDAPQLRGRPVVVGGSPTGRGVVAAASYEARRFGIRSAMPAARAQRLCPDVVFVPPDFAKYKAVSAQVFAIFRSVTPLVEPLSLDEAYLDVTDNLLQIPSATHVAAHVREQIWRQVGLTASAGVAPVKFVAKIASDLDKPNGLVVVPPHRVLEVIRPLPVTKLWGVGPATATRLDALGVRTIQDLADLGQDKLIDALGKQGHVLWRMSHGEDPRPVRPSRERKSSSAERTFAQDVLDMDLLEAVLHDHAERVCAALERAGSRGRTVTLKIRYADFETRTRSSTLSEATRAPGVVHAVAVQLLGRTDAGQRPVRLIGLGLSGLGKGEGPRRQLDLFAGV